MVYNILWGIMLTSSLQFRQRVYSEKTVSVSKSSIFRSKLNSSLMFIFSDLVSLLIVFSIIYLASDFLKAISFTLTFQTYFLLAAGLIITNFVLGLFPGYGIDPVDEIRSLFYGSVITGMILFTVCSHIATTYRDPAWVCILFPFFLFLALSINRRLIRRYFSSSSWWGIPSLVYGKSSDVQSMTEGLLKNKEVGLKPRVLIESDDPISDTGIEKTLSDIETIEYISDKTNIDHIVIAISDSNKDFIKQNIKKISDIIKKVTIVYDTSALSSLWISSRNLNINRSKEQFRIMKNANIMLKQFFDKILSLLFLILSSPLIFLSAILVKLETKGCILYKSKRIGKDNKYYNILKFRTMVDNADNALKEILRKNPDLKEEYYKYHKLKKDPRITKAGRYLRKFYIDEIPQFLNVLFGSMSIIGHRPVGKGESQGTEEYKDLISKLPPGLTGLWQVTDSYAATFERRTLLDIYYIRNWSFFLDIYILAKTVIWVLKGKGK